MSYRYIFIFSGGFRGVARRAWPPFNFRPNWGSKGRKVFSETDPPFSQGLDDWAFRQRLMFVILRQTSDIWSVMFDVWCQLSNIRRLMSLYMSHVYCLMSDAWCLMSVVLCLLSDVRHLLSDVWCQMCDVCCLMWDVTIFESCQTSYVICLMYNMRC